jgi:hypothetical protein
MNLTFRGHIDHGIADQLGRASQPPTRRQAFGLVKFDLVSPKRGQAIRSGFDSVLWKRSFAETDLTTAANGSTPADGIQIHTEISGRLKHGCAMRHPTATARGREYNKKILWHIQIIQKSDGGC